MEFEVVVIGAGIAGASLAAALAPHRRVCVMESEPHAGYHSTGRSAALFSEIYGNACIRALTRASRSFLFDPPVGFAPSPLVRPRETLYFARGDQRDRLTAFREDADVGAATVVLSGSEVDQRVPVFRPGWIEAAALDRRSADIDVDLLHQGFLRQARAAGAELRFKVPVTALERHSKGWEILAGDERIVAPVVVNAAGAWGDAVARKAGIAAVGLAPMRRTAILIDAPEGLRIDAWPAAIAIDESFYFKPDAGALLLSPADEQLSPACDAQPEELDVAIAVDRYEEATGQTVRRIRHQWAGLRVFSPDRSPIVGFDPTAAGFFWLAGQGGYGIQTCDAIARIAAALILDRAIPTSILDWGVTAQMLNPSRIGRGR